MTIKNLNGFDINKPVHAYLVLSSGMLAAREYSSALAAALMCEKPSSVGEPCNECAACKKVSAGTHPDVFTLGRNKVSVDDIRELRSKIHLTANESDRKIYILENAELFNEASQNALLKMLEEPPKGVVFILTASSKSAVLPTILSRVCVLTPEKQDFKYFMNTAWDIFGKEADEETVEAAAAYFEAYDCADVSDFQPEVFEKAYRLSIDYLSGKQQNIISAFPNPKAASKNDVELYLKIFMLTARNAMIYKLSSGKAQIYPCSDEFRRLCLRLSAKRALNCYETFEDAYISFKDFAEKSRNQNTLYAYLYKKV